MDPVHRGVHGPGVSVFGSPKFFGVLIPCDALCLLKRKFSVKRLLQVSDLVAEAGFQSSPKEK